jgi:hypothetical protein
MDLMAKLLESTSWMLAKLQKEAWRFVLQIPVSQPENLTVFAGTS